MNIVIGSGLRSVTKPIILTLSVFLGFGMADKAQARLGESLDQITARYGPGAPAGKGVVMFHKQNWNITVWLLNGVSAQENFQKNGGAADEDIANLLSINAQGHQWTPAPVSTDLVGTLFPTIRPVIKAWTRNDGGAYAYIPGGGDRRLNIESKEKIDADAADNAARKKASESSTQGF